MTFYYSTFYKLSSSQLYHFTNPDRSSWQPVPFRTYLKSEKIKVATQESTGLTCGKVSVHHLPSLIMGAHVRRFVSLWPRSHMVWSSWLKVQKEQQRALPTEHVTANDNWQHRCKNKFKEDIMVKSHNNSRSGSMSANLTHFGSRQEHNCGLAQHNRRHSSGPQSSRKKKLCRQGSS